MDYLYTARKRGRGTLLRNRWPQRGTGSMFLPSVTPVKSIPHQQLLEKCTTLEHTCNAIKDVDQLLPCARADTRNICHHTPQNET